MTKMLAVGRAEAAAQRQTQREEDQGRAEEEERSSYCGYIESEHDEILSDGMKPWDDDADAFLS